MSDSWRTRDLLREALAMCQRNSTNGQMVRRLEEAFATYVGADYAIALCNGTATLHTALVALGVGPGDTVAVPPLTMASTTLGVLHAGATPVFVDIDRKTWLMSHYRFMGTDSHTDAAVMPVSLYGLWSGTTGGRVVDDAAETLNHHRGAAFTSYSFQASKILAAGEGGMLVTNDATLAAKARQFRDLGYPPDARANMKSPTAVRHTSIGHNYRLSDLQAAVVLGQLERADELLAARRYSADCYRQAIQGADWITPQHVPWGWPHSFWAYTVLLKNAETWEPLAQAIQTLGGERPYAAWRITYQEPAFRHLAPDGTCPVAEDLQPRLMQLQTNHCRMGAERAADILHRAIKALA